MDTRRWNEIIDVVVKTGDTCIVADTEKSFVLMDIKKYRAMLLERELHVSHLTDSGLLDKINAQIALWHESQKELFVDTPEQSDILQNAL
ncbi:MAG: hypothetical protein AAB400_05280 [Patescibacteria group bacterium]|mgnify:CR=1 FL=1